HARTGAEAAGPVAFSPDGAVLALFPSPSAVRLIDFGRNKELATLPVAHPHPVTSLRFSPDGRWLAPGTDRGLTHPWALAAGRARRGPGARAVAGPGGLSSRPPAKTRKSHEPTVLWARPVRPGGGVVPRPGACRRAAHRRGIRLAVSAVRRPRPRAVSGASG